MSEQFPPRLRYTTDHEWVSVEDGLARVGITAHAQDALGDIVFVQLPAVGESVTAGAACGEVESTKSVSDLFSPVDGEVVEVNPALEDQPELVNSEPYGQGWMFVVKVVGEPQGLLDAAEYAASLG